MLGLSRAHMPEPSYVHVCNSSVSEWDFEVGAVFAALCGGMRLCRHENLETLQTVPSLIHN